MIKIVQGDLLKSDCDIIMHQCNCYLQMGAGITKQIKEKYPQVYTADKSFPIPIGLERLGKFSYATDKDRLIINLYGQGSYGRTKVHTEYDHFQKALEDAIKMVKEFRPNAKIGLPYGIGSGLAGGNWNIVSGIIDEVSDCENITIYLYKL